MDVTTGSWISREPHFSQRTREMGYPVLTFREKPCDQIGRLPYNWLVLTEEDKQWINERLEKVETTLLTEFHKWASPIELRQRSHAAVLRALDAEVESVSDRLKNLEGR
jgi:hypothetical protein